MLLAFIIIFLVAALMLGLFAAGVCLAWFGVRGGYVGNHPHCKRCGYNLYGRTTQPSQCPECGNDISREGAVSWGLRKINRPQLFAGIALIILSTTPITLSGCFAP